MDHVETRIAKNSVKCLAQKTVQIASEIITKERRILSRFCEKDDVNLPLERYFPKLGFNIKSDASRFLLAERQKLIQHSISTVLLTKTVLEPTVLQSFIQNSWVYIVEPAVQVIRLCNYEPVWIYRNSFLTLISFILVYVKYTDEKQKELRQHPRSWSKEVGKKNVSIK